MAQLIKSAPSHQIELDMFRGDWTYKIPIPGTVTGKEQVQEVPWSVHFARTCFGSLNGSKVLELGPHECELTIALSKEKVDKVISIEARRQAYLKCLIIKNILELNNVRFLLGNFVEYLRTESEHFDLCLACGVLYHMTDPVELIEMICNSCDRVVVASIYVNDNLIHYDKSKDWSKLPEANWNIVDEKGEDVEYKGLKVKYFKNYYVDPWESGHIVYGHGGVDDYSNMMELNDIIRAFEHFGFEIVGEVLDDPDGPRGPHVAFAAKKRDVPRAFTKDTDKYQSEHLIKSAPSNQIELDQFKNEWAYKLPIPNTVTGKEKVQEVPGSVRIARKRFGPLDGFKVLELGPNECEITVGLSKEKVESVTSIECRSRTFFKCLIVKNMLDLKNVRFLLGNFVEYLRTQNEKFDLCVASDVLYHVIDPVELIEMICNSCDRVVVASIYVNDNLIHYDKSKDWSRLPEARWNIVDDKGEEVEYKGFKFKCFKNQYFDAGGPSHIVYGHGGVDDYSNMMELNDIVRAFEHFGFEIVGEIRDDPDGPRGPYAVFAAKRRDVPLNFKRNRYLKVYRYMMRQFKKRLGFLGT